MVVIEILVILAVLAFLVYWVWGAADRRRIDETRWRVVTKTASDGSLRVLVEGPGGERLVKELPPGLDGAELTAELRLAREEAALQADELNRPVRTRT